MQITEQLQNTAPQTVQKQIFVNNKKIDFLVCTVIVLYMHVPFRGYYELIYYSFVLFITVDSH